MSADATPAPVPRRPRARRGLLVAGAVLGVLLILFAVTWLNRRAATRQVLIGWLEQQGVDADMQIERLEMDGLVARVRIGDPRNPDVTIERVEVDYGIGAPWSKGGLGVTPTRIRLVRPVVRASVRGGKLTFGSLDPLVEKFTGRPPRPDSRSPLVIVERARVRLDTDYGPANILGDARIDNGKLMRLVAHMPATAFKSGEAEARGLSAAVDLTTTGDRIAVRLDAAAEHATLPGLAGDTARLVLTGNLPYPDLKGRRGDGRAAINAAFTAARLTSGETTARGAGDLDVRAARIDGPAAASGARLRLDRAQTVFSRDARGFGWRLEGPAVMVAARASGAGLDGTGVTVRASNLVLGGRGAALEAQGPVALSADRLAWDDLVLTGARSRGRMDMVVDQGLRLDATGSLTAARGSWPLFGPAARDDIPELAGMKQALSAFAVDIPAFSVTAAPSGARVVLTRPATLRPANGGVLTLRPAAGSVFSAARGQAGGGALGLTAT
ncbi:MAG TPA: C4-dicarboxylate ABC transporter, partial [Brevundimonas sp.]|nr:C4-dicarboxylate ABC transporter [Brevundimonas sp.]